MGIFNFFTNKQHPANEAGAYQNNTTEDRPSAIPEDIFVERGQPNAESGLADPVVSSVVNNIDMLYRFLDRNLESKGYDDALMNPDSYHLEQNLDAQRKELIRTIKKVKTFYEDFIREINYHIDSRSRSGMIDTVEELKMKKEIATSHIEKVLIMEEDANLNTGDSQGIMVSYTKGFKNGLAAISHHTIISRKF